MRTPAFFIGIGLLLGAGAATLAVAAGREAGRATESHRIAERRDHFLEAEDGRRLAQIDTVLVREADGAKALRVHVRVRGPEVDAEPGFEGVPGHNLRSALELTRLLERGALSARLVGLRSGRVLPIPLVPEARRSLPARRAAASGRLDLQARTEERYVGGLRLHVGALPDEALRFELLVDGAPRLAGELEAGRDRLDRFRAVGGLHRTTRGWR